MTGKRIVFCTLGSLGDLYPILALAREMDGRVGLGVDHGVIELGLPSQRAYDAMGHGVIDPQKDLIAPLGMLVRELDKAFADSMCGLRSLSGLVVAGKVDYAPAIDADLAIGDVVRSINGARVTTIGDFRSALDRFKTGDSVVLEVERQGRYRFVPFEME